MYKENDITENIDIQYLPKIHVKAIRKKKNFDFY